MGPPVKKNLGLSGLVHTTGMFVFLSTMFYSVLNYWYQLYPRPGMEPFWLESPLTASDMFCHVQSMRHCADYFKSNFVGNITCLSLSSPPQCTGYGKNK